MKTFKIEIAYDGTDYHGWQIQPKDETVASRMQKSFLKAFEKKITLIGASRTDSGVHALGQIAKFKTDLNVDPSIILQTWNGRLPKDISVRKVEAVSDNFHPHSNVHQKTYYYHLFTKRPLPFIARYGWHYKFIDLIDIEKFNKALKFYIGEHDFTSFCKLDPEKTPIRKIDNITLKKFDNFGAIQVVIKGKSFLRFQIRRMIGYALDVASRPNIPIDYIKSILDNPNPQQRLIKADGCGLVLRKIVYKHELITKK